MRCKSDSFEALQPIEDLSGYLIGIGRTVAQVEVWSCKFSELAAMAVGFRNSSYLFCG